LNRITFKKHYRQFNSKEVKLNLSKKGIICMKLAMLVALSLFVTACTGSAYKLPVVSQSEIAQVENQIKSDKNDLKVYNRSDSNYRSRVSSISKNLQKKAKPLCDYAEYSPCRFEVKYSNENIINAYAHDNYKITVFKGFLQYLQNNDEMAALIAHEMGHHLAKHNQETQRNAETGAVVSGLVTALLLGAANANNPYYSSYQQQQNQQTIENMMNVGFEIGAISYSKEQEREADLLATYLLKHAGYNLNKAQNLMYTMAKLKGDRVEGHAALASTHPPTPERVVAWEKAIEEIKSNNTLLPYQKDGAP